MKNTLFAVLLLTAAPPAHAKTQLYLSPGLQIGYGSGQGFFFSAQVSAGIIVEGIAPAVTIGIRQYKDQTIRYADVQLTLLSASFYPYGTSGIGIGMVWASPGDTTDGGSGIITGLRLKLYGGFLLWSTYDAYKLPGRPIKHHLGILLTVPWIYYEGGRNR